MKKLFICCVFVSVLSVCDVIAEDSSRHDGFYIACGVLGERTKGKTSYLGDDIPNALLLRPSEIPKGKLNSIDKVAWSFGGSIAFGFGSMIFGTYVGGELLVDAVSRNVLKDKYVLYEKQRENYLKMGSLVPALMLRLGGYVDRFGTLFLVRIGVTRISYEYVNPSFKVVSGFKANKLRPVLGISAEKKFGRFGLRFDYDYCFKAVANGSVRTAQYKYDFKTSLNRRVLRIMGVFYL